MFLRCSCVFCSPSPSSRWRLPDPKTKNSSKTKNKKTKPLKKVLAQDIPDFFFERSCGFSSGVFCFFAILVVDEGFQIQKAKKNCYKTSHVKNALGADIESLVFWSFELFFGFSWHVFCLFPVLVADQSFRIQVQNQKRKRENNQNTKNKTQSLWRTFWCVACGLGFKSQRILQKKRAKRGEKIVERLGLGHTDVLGLSAPHSLSQTSSQKNFSRHLIRFLHILCIHLIHFLIVISQTFCVTLSIIFCRCVTQILYSLFYNQPSTSTTTTTITTSFLHALTSSSSTFSISQGDPDWSTEAFKVWLLDRSLQSLTFGTSFQSEFEQHDIFRDVSHSIFYI